MSANRQVSPSPKVLPPQSRSAIKDTLCPKLPQAQSHSAGSLAPNRTTPCQQPLQTRSLSASSAFDKPTLSPERLRVGNRITVGVVPRFLIASSSKFLRVRSQPESKVTKSPNPSHGTSRVAPGSKLPRIQSRLVLLRVYGISKLS